MTISKVKLLIWVTTVFTQLWVRNAEVEGDELQLRWKKNFFHWHANYIRHANFFKAVFETFRLSYAITKHYKIPYSKPETKHDGEPARVKHDCLFANHAAVKKEAVRTMCTASSLQKSFYPPSRCKELHCSITFFFFFIFYYTRLSLMLAINYETVQNCTRRPPQFLYQRLNQISKTNKKWIWKK